MLFLWLGLAGFSAVIAYHSFTKGSYVRGAFAAFWLAVFLFSIWIDLQQVGTAVA